MTDQKNLILAIVLSVAIMVGFQFLPWFHAPVAPPPPAAQTDEPITAPNVASEAPADASESPGRAVGEAAVTAETLPRDQALASVPRVRIDTQRPDPETGEPVGVVGSLSLVGARIDDLALVKYRETLNPASPAIVLLSPLNAPSPYYADFGWTADDPALALPGPDTLWTADSEVLTAAAPVTLSWDNGQGLVFQRVIAIDQNYMFTVTQRVINNGAGAVSVRPYGRVLRFGVPHTEGFFILHEGPYGVIDGSLQEYSYSDLQEDGTIAARSTGGWLGFTDKYWLVALAPDQQVPVDTSFIHVVAQGGQDRFLSTYQAQTEEVAPGATAETTAHLFAGAKEVALMDAYKDQLGIQKFDLTIDFGWFYFITKPFFYLLAFIHGLVGNFGLSILAFTILVKLAFYPLASKSYRSMSRMKALAPEMTKIRERFKDDRQRVNQEMMALYKREKVNPAAGCLPIVIQIPVFFALYKVLFVTIEMRHAPFFGWIRDLSAPDPTTIFNLFGLIPWTPPHMLMIGAWPLIMGVTMFLQQKLNPAPADPMQARIFMLLPVVFTFMLANFPAGLVIYWAWNNTLSMAQQWFIMKRMGVKIGGGMVEKPVAAPPEPPPPLPAPARPAPQARTTGSVRKGAPPRPARKRN